MHDEKAVELIDELDYDFSALAESSKGTMYQFGFLEVAMRQTDLAWVVRDKLSLAQKMEVLRMKNLHFSIYCHSCCSAGSCIRITLAGTPPTTA